MAMSTQEEAARAAGDPKYQKQVAEAIDRTVKRIAERKEPPVAVDVATDRWIIFSDLHKGIGDTVDDFRRNERAYNAALAYYHRLGYRLVVLGDVEELWKERPGPVIERYQRTLELEAKFHKAGRYCRIWGNHDDLWRHDGSVQRRLKPIFGEGLNVLEGLYLEVREGGDPLGRILLIHGHQGTSDADPDRIGPWAKFVVRWIWRPVQRITKLSFNTPAKDWALRHRHSVAMYRWAAAQRPPLVLVAGHTHQPVFRSKSLEQQKLELAQAKQDELSLEQDPVQRAALEEELASLEAWVEWARAGGRGQKGAAPPVGMDLPCYFNTGCCCFTDGDVTGLEIAGGEIRLVRWPRDDGSPGPETLAATPVREVFAALGA
ncbi:MAG TPA: metallophosphoesterase [Longimicrobium sp.]